MPQVIETPRLLLRPFRLDDVDAVFAMHSEPHVERFFGATTRAEVEEWLVIGLRTWAEGGYTRLAMVDRATGEFVGRSGLKHWEQFDEVEVGWMVRAAHLGRGYATEAGRASLDWGFANLSVDYITAMIRHENTESIAVAERLGMSFLREDRLHDAPTLVFAISRPLS